MKATAYVFHNSAALPTDISALLTWNEARKNETPKITLGTFTDSIAAEFYKTHNIGVAVEWAGSRITQSWYVV